MVKNFQNWILEQGHTCKNIDMGGIRNLYILDSSLIYYAIFSIIHNNHYFFGPNKENLELMSKFNVFIVFICEDFNNNIIIKATKFLDIYKKIKIIDGCYKIHISTSFSFKDGDLNYDLKERINIIFNKERINNLDININHELLTKEKEITR